MTNEHHSTTNKSGAKSRLERGIALFYFDSLMSPKLFHSLTSSIISSFPIFFLLYRPVFSFLFRSVRSDEAAPEGGFLQISSYEALVPVIVDIWPLLRRALIWSCLN
jgi:hypothetical protein